MKRGDRARARRNFELALQATEEQVYAAVVSRRVEYLTAQGALEASAKLVG